MKIARKQKNIVWSTLKNILGTSNYERIRASYNLGYMPSIKKPQTFNEKLMYKKLYSDMSHAGLLTDKYEVRDFVEKKVGEHILNKVFFLGKNITFEHWQDLPKKFVIKATHTGGGEGNIFVTDKSKETLSDINAKIDVFLRLKFGSVTNECWYKGIVPRILVEEMMQDSNGTLPKDFKFFCFHGKCHYIQVDIDRFGEHKRTFYDTSWTEQEFSLLFEKGPGVVRPTNLTEMIAIAEKLSSGFDFLRVDLYSVNNETRFGELTFCPGSGWEPFVPNEYDRVLGALI